MSFKKVQWVDSLKQIISNWKTLMEACVQQWMFFFNSAGLSLATMNIYCFNLFYTKFQVKPYRNFKDVPFYMQLDAKRCSVGALKKTEKTLFLSYHRERKDCKQNDSYLTYNTKYKFLRSCKKFSNNSILSKLFNTRIY